MPRSSLEDAIELLHITDTHLFGDVDGSLLSVNTLDSFKAVINGVMNQNSSFDVILSTGDISQDHSAKSYELFEEHIIPLKQHCFWLPGNHDFKPSMEALLPSRQVKQSTHVLLGDHWQMILLDSQVVGVPYGHLAEEQLELLEEKLSASPERYSLVLLHHPPVLVGSQWLDQHTLKNSDDFWKRVSKYPNVKGIICGHVHQEVDVYCHNVRVLATPSTCVQFKPNSDTFALDALSPGWRQITLHNNGDLSTSVRRLTQGQFQPNFNSTGY